jgi:hypothetical protein
MKSNAITAVGVALVDLPLAVEPHLLFRIRRAEMEGGTCAALARLAVAQVDPFRITRGDDAKRATVALSGSFHQVSSHPNVSTTLADLLGCRRVASNGGCLTRIFAIRKASLVELNPVTLGRTLRNGRLDTAIRPWPRRQADHQMPRRGKTVAVPASAMYQTKRNSSART